LGGGGNRGNTVRKKIFKKKKRTVTDILKYLWVLMKTVMIFGLQELEISFTFVFPGIINLLERFSNFFQVGTTFISQSVLRTTLPLSPLKANLSLFLNDKFV
jgi:hypothetical protein